MPMLEGGFNITSTNGNLITLTTASATNFFNNFAVKQTDMYARMLGLYADVNLGKNLEGVFMSFNTPRNLLSKRTNGCTWHPKTGLRVNIDTFPTCPVEFDGEQCPDVFFGTCFERIFTPASTSPLTDNPEVQSLLNKMVERINLGLGNSFFDLYNFANHPLIESANTAGTYASNADWDNYYDQQMSGECGGLITQFDALGDSVEFGQYYNGVIATGASGINTTTDAFDGDITALFDDVINRAHPNLRIAINNGVMINGALRMPVILATDAEFEAYRKFIADMAPGNTYAYQFMLTGVDGNTIRNPNILEYRGLPVIRWEANTTFDATVGTKSHRVAIVAPQSLGVLSNVGDISNRLFSGVGLAIQESPVLKDKGKIFMHTNFRWGAAIADPNMAVMVKRIIMPAN